MTQPSPDGYLVPTVRTPITPEVYTLAVIQAWPRVLGGAANPEACAVLWAQYFAETGGRACWGWNIGNVKKRVGDGYNYQALRGVWEGFSPAEAARLIALGHAKSDPSADHAKAVGPGLVSVLFEPSHHMSWFRVYADLSDAMESHINFLACGRYSDCWKHVIAGEPEAFAKAIHAKGYFQSSPERYGANMRGAYDKVIAAGVFEAVSPKVDPLGDTDPDLQAYNLATRPILDKA